LYGVSVRIPIRDVDWSAERRTIDSMAIPTYDKFIEPVLRHLALNPQGARTRDVYEAAASALGISEQEKLELLPSGAQPVYKNRAGWAHDRLKRAGLSSSPQRGFWHLTDGGRAYAEEHSAPLSEEQVKDVALAHRDVRLRPVTADDAGEVPGGEVEEIPGSTDITSSPDDRLELALSELRASTAGDLLEAISQASPKFFETLVLDLLHAMGYGASREDLQHVGQPGDAGIDGIISLDRLGLEKVYVQAKRWQNTVGRESVHAFYGALAGQHATKGVLITTSVFTAHAREFARSVEKLVLIDGERLAALMMEYGVAVTHRVVKVPKLDLDYFEE
jgi:restriction system protein